ncbi:RNA-binding 15 [Brachionus plicatilis]|uniref:RNA-binding 15 n=1 Tax=Brachionus plicatilis TaxID=10195 RepID=A0A3M7PJ28_BRAPC|nr:RNA-binding 15 [Brachionus plicatilis]
MANRLSSPRRPRAPQPLMKSPAAPPPSLSLSSAMHYFDDDDKDQTRTLFIGNLDADIQKDFLWKQFERYGALEEIDIKKNLPPGHADYAKKTYAFVRYENMDMAKEAKVRMNAKRIGQSEIKIGYVAQTQFNRVRDSITEVEMPLHLHFKSIHSLNLLMSVSKQTEEHGELIEAL